MDYLNIILSYLQHLFKVISNNAAFQSCSIANVLNYLTLIAVGALDSVTRVPAASYRTA